MSDPIVNPPRNFVAISAPRSGDVICGTTVSAGGTYNGVTSITVNLDGVTATATLSGGAWRATLNSVSKGTYTLTATPNGVTPPAAEPNITVESPCTHVVSNPPPLGIAQNYVVNGTYDATPNTSGVTPSVTADLIHPPSPFPIPNTAILTTVAPSAGTWTFTLPTVMSGSGYTLEVRRNDGSTGTKLAGVNIGPFTIT